MDLKIFHLFLVVALFQVCQGLNCAQDDPCELVGTFSTARGYGCVQRGQDNVLCRCPNGEYEQDKPCRLCNRTNPLQNACNKQSSRYIMCLEIADYGTSYVCLCIADSGQLVATTSWDCDLSVTLTSTTTTTSTAASIVGVQCANGGVLVNGICHCPSGFEGGLCERRNEANLCNRITCKNKGVTSIRPVNGPYECVCLCRSGTSGDYCQLNGTLGTCATAGCTNGANCRQVTIETTTHSYCECAAGFKGSKCETQYFACPKTGFFTDLEMFDHGKYFECVVSGGSLRAIQRSCAKGLRYNMNLAKCTY